MAITREEAQNLGLVELYDEVKCLETLTDQAKIIEKLQDIGAKLLTEYEVRVDELLLEPLWIEAYYHRAGVFEDDNCHKKPDQYNRFGKLYFQPGSAGIDVCLSNGNYFLSFLIKNAVIRASHVSSDIGQFLTQYYVSDCLVSAISEQNRDAYYLVPNCNRNLDEEFPVFFERKGLSHVPYKDANLAVVKTMKDFKIEQKELKAKLYIEQNLSAEWNTMSESDRKQWSNKLLGYECADVWQHTVEK